MVIIVIWIYGGPVILDTCILNASLLILRTIYREKYPMLLALFADKKLRHRLCSLHRACARKLGVEGKNP